jgi:hypothetical protein
MEGDREPVRIFRMPGRVTRRSEHIDDVARLGAAKAKLESAIAGLSQVSGTTNLQVPIEAALEILRSQRSASRRIMVLGSDFLTDTGKGRVSAEPPVTTSRQSSATVEALLLVTYPKRKYMAPLAGTPTALFHNIESGWSDYMASQHVSGIQVRLVDSVPIGSSESTAADVMGGIQ